MPCRKRKDKGDREGRGQRTEKGERKGEKGGKKGGGEGGKEVQSKEDGDRGNWISRSGLEDHQ